MAISHLPDLVDRVLLDLSQLGIHPAVRNQFPSSSPNLTFPFIDSAKKVLSIFFVEMEAGETGHWGWELRWEMGEGDMRVTFSVPPSLAANPALRCFPKTHQALQCLGGSLDIREGVGSLTLPMQHGLSRPNPPTPEESPAGAAVSSLPIFSSSVLEQACPDQEFARQLVEDFLRQSALQIRELEDYLSQGSPSLAPLIHRLAHSIKGGALNVGAFRLAQAARVIEGRAKMIIGTDPALSAPPDLPTLAELLEQLKKEHSLFESTYREGYG